MIPSVVWGWFFVSRNPETRQLVVVTFLLGTLAVVPLLLFMAGLGIQLRTYEAAAAQGVTLVAAASSAASSTPRSTRSNGRFERPFDASSSATNARARSLSGFPAS